jgi:gliding motility-associated-like protein
VVSVSGTSAVCARSELRLTGSSNLEAVQYAWKNDAGQLLGTGETYLLAAAEAGNSGRYTLTASKDGCVSAPVSYTVTVKPLPEIEISTLGVFCQNTTVEMKASSSLPGTRFEWMADNGNETSGQSFKIAGLSGDSVRCTVIARNNGCSTQKNVVLPVKKLPHVELNPIGPLCQNAGFTRFTAIETTGLPGKGAFSGPGINAGGYFNPSAAAGTYTITYRYTTTDGCYDEKTTDVKVYPVPAVNAGPDLVMYEGKSVKLEGSVSGLYQSFQWQPAETGMQNNLLQPVVHPRTSTTYRLTATTEQGCTAFDEVSVKVLKFRIPNAFSPNGDGINDKWVIEGLYHFSNCLVEIYSRWGTLLFRSQGYNTPWDGTYKGQPVPVGTYYYLINLNDGLTKEPVAGWVEVLH